MRNDPNAKRSRRRVFRWLLPAALLVWIAAVWLPVGYACHFWFSEPGKLSNIEVSLLSGGERSGFHKAPPEETEIMKQLLSDLELRPAWSATSRRYSMNDIRYHVSFLEEGHGVPFDVYLGEVNVVQTSSFRRAIKIHIQNPEVLTVFLDSVDTSTWEKW